MSHHVGVEVDDGDAEEEEEADMGDADEEGVNLAGAARVAWPGRALPADAAGAAGRGRCGMVCASG